MNKNAIKKYAVWARRELIERVSQRAMIYGITTKDSGDPNAESVNGHLLSQVEKRQRQALIRNIKAKGYEQVMEEVAYTWFNRFAALRFMEVNGYLPSHIRVFTNDAGEFKPQILAEAIHLELDGLDMNKVYELESANKSEELFKYLLIVQCNALNSILPGMFQRIEDYTELLLPDYLLREGSVIEQMITTIPEEDWTDQVQIIGWLYQYYNTEPKDKVFADLKKNIKITKENIPAATQLFTPDWIVHYMVENSLGRLWLEGHPNDALKSEWKYYLDEAEQEPDVQAQLATIRKEYAALKPEEIRVIDPCMGSGHILCVLFDVLVRIYEDYGYTAREAAVKIVENNLWGLDIDERAAQLSYFAVMMKARQYDRRFFTRKVQPHVYAIEETNLIRSDYTLAKKDYHLSTDNQAALDYLMRAFVDAKEYGSILQLKNHDYTGLKDEWDSMYAQTNNDNRTISLWSALVSPLIPILCYQAIALSQKYHVVVTNPPYMGGSGMCSSMVDYLKDNYPDSKSDLFAVFIERCHLFLKENGLQGMITQHAWMFLRSYERLRQKLFQNDMINMAHLGARAFEEIGGEVVQTTSFVFRKSRTQKYVSNYLRLIDASSQNEKEKLFLTGKPQFSVSQENYEKIPGSPVAYWVSDRVFAAYSNPPLIQHSRPCKGIDTGDNSVFLRLWYEINIQKMFHPQAHPVKAADCSGYKWFPYNKGGEYRKWYGNNDYLLNWENDGAALRAFRKSNLRNKDCYLNRGITWSTVTGSQSSMRYFDYGFLFDNGGSCLYTGDNLLYILGFLNSKVAKSLLSISPTLNTQPGDIGRLPYILSEEKKGVITELVQKNIAIAKADWDAFETSWDFIEHPFITYAEKGCATTVRQAYENWSEVATSRFVELRKNEEAINQIFIDIYNLSNELTAQVEDKEISVRKANLQRDIRSFISFAVGCMFGRFSIGKPGLVYAGGEWDASMYQLFKPDKDAIIPICDDEYFEDDIVGRFVKFIEVVFGKDTLEENLRFISDALGGKGASREVIRNYFINEFYADHIKTYQKRPIYWLFDSGKTNGFKCLIYMHRYQPDTIARIRTDYVHEQQSRYRTAIADLNQRISGASSSERIKLSKRLDLLQSQAEEIRAYEEKIHHLADQMIKIDLDDGVKNNYSLFKDVLAKMK